MPQSNGHDTGEAILKAWYEQLEVNRALTKSNTRLADAVALLADAVRKQQAPLEQIAEARYERNLILDTESNRALTMANGHLKAAEAVYDKTLAIARDEMRSKLEVISHNVTETRREHQTGQHHLQPPDDGVPVAMAKTIAGLPAARFYALLVAVVVLVLASGGVGALWHRAFGTDSTSTEIKTRVERHEKP